MRAASGAILGFLVGALSTAAAAVFAGAGPPREPPAPVHPVVVTLHRFELKPGKLARFGDWMRLYRTQHRATVATLEREHTYFEALFRDRARAPDVVWWLEAQGEGGARVGSSPLPIDRQYEAFMDEVLKPGARSRLDTEFVLMPDFIVEAIRAHQAGEAAAARRGR